MGFSSRERRRDERRPLRAYVRCQTRSVTYLLAVANASRDGLFLSGDPRGLHGLKLGSDVELALLPADQPEGEPVFLRGVIARVSAATENDPGGFGIEVDGSRSRDMRRYRELLRST